MIGPSETPGIGPIVWGSDGGQWQAISQKHSWMRARGARTVEWPALTMQGQTVFRWAVWQMAPVAQQAMEKAGISAEDLDAFIPHQANMRIIDSMVKAMRLPPEVPVARDIATPATPPPPRSRWPWTGCSRRVRPRTAAWPC